MRPGAGEPLLQREREQHICSLWPLCLRVFTSECNHHFNLLERRKYSPPESWQMMRRQTESGLDQVLSSSLSLSVTPSWVHKSSAASTGSHPRLLPKLHFTCLTQNIFINPPRYIFSPKPLLKFYVIFHETSHLSIRRIFLWVIKIRMYARCTSVH